jgi:hypothetical protein
MLPIYCTYNVWEIISQIVLRLQRLLTFFRIDDIQDDAQLRKGVPVAHKIYGIPLTLNCANAVFFMAMAGVTGFDSPTEVTSTNCIVQIMLPCRYIY